MPTATQCPCPVQLSAAPPPCSSGQNVQRAMPCPLQPALLIGGDTIIRNIRSSALVHSLSGAKVADILHHLPSVLNKYTSLQNVIIHIECYDIQNQKSEILKVDFNKLSSFLDSCGKNVHISGPELPLGRGSGCFSHTFSLHSWLLGTCPSRNLGFTDSFNLFWNPPSFRNDGIHPSIIGTKVLRDSVFYSVQNTAPK